MLLDVVMRGKFENVGCGMISHGCELRFCLFFGIRIGDEDCPGERDADGNLLPMFLDDYGSARKSLQASYELPLDNTKTNQLGAILAFRSLDDHRSTSFLNLVQRNRVGFSCLGDNS